MRKEDRKGKRSFAMHLELRDDGYGRRVHPPTMHVVSWCDNSRGPLAARTDKGWWLKCFECHAGVNTCQTSWPHYSAVEVLSRVRRSTKAVRPRHQRESFV